MAGRRIGAALRARPRLLGAGGAALVAFVLLSGLRLSTRFLVAYDLAVVLFLALGWTMMARSSYDDLQRRADEEDAGAVVVLVLSAMSAVASLVAIAAELNNLRDPGIMSEGVRIALAAGTILASWLFVHTIFALHYAHDFYFGDDDRGGLKFPGEDQPDYWDFMYFSFNLGAAAQTSDVMVEAPRMRRFVLAHTVLSFLFNTTILALAINVGASLIGGVGKP